MQGERLRMTASYNTKHLSRVAGITAALCELKQVHPTLTLMNYKTIGLISVGTVVLIYACVRLYF